MRTMTGCVRIGRRQAYILLERCLRCTDSKVGAVGDLQGAAARPLRETALGERLNPPGDAAEQELLVIRARLLAEHFDVLLTELAGRHVAQRFNFLPDCDLHGTLLSRGR